MRQMTTETPQRGDTETLRVRAPITDPVGSLRFESMHARLDPAAADQAMLNNAPFCCDYLNFGDLVRVGTAVDNLRPILEVVTASGHVRVAVDAGTGRNVRGLVDWLLERFPEYALRMEGDGGRLLMVSIHPDLDPADVDVEIADWLDEQGARGDRSVCVSEPIETQLGPVEWPAE